MVLYNDKVVSFNISVLEGPGNGNVSSPDVDNILIFDQSEYDALTERSDKTLYLIRG